MKGFGRTEGTHNECRAAAGGGRRREYFKNITGEHYYCQNKSHGDQTCTPRSRTAAEVRTAGPRGHVDAARRRPHGVDAAGRRRQPRDRADRQPLAADVVPHAPAELSKHGDAAVIVIRPVAALERIPGVTLVPMPDGRALISLDDSMTTYEFELKLRDVLDDQNIDRAELPAMQSISEILKSARQTGASRCISGGSSSCSRRGGAGQTGVPPPEVELRPGGAVSWSSRAGSASCR